MFIEQSERIESSWTYPSKADLLNRFIAKSLDFLVVAALYEIPLRVSFLFGMAYLSIADGLVGGSLGKRFIGLKVLIRENQKSVSFRESILRNLPLTLAYLLYHIPFVGWIIAIGIIGFESFLMIGNPKGIRLGDELAKTCVLDQQSKGENIHHSAGNTT